MTIRAHIPLKEKLASALCQMLCDDGTGKLVPVIPYEHAKQMSADQVLSLWHWDHWPVRKVDGGPDLHFNIVPRLIADHLRKTRTIDQPQIAKRKRIVRANDAAVNRLLARADGEPPQPQRIRVRSIPSRPFPKGHRPLHGRNDLRRREPS